jgi:hypothetical protein
VIASLRTLIMLMIGLLLGACAVAGPPAPTSALTRYYGSGVIVEETRPVDTFRRVQIEMTAELHIAQGERESLRIAADDNLLPYLTSAQDGDLLTLGLQAGVDIVYSAPVAYRLTVHELTELHIARNFDARLVDLALDSLRLVLYGEGQMTLSGAAQQLAIDAQGAIIVEAQAFPVRTARVAFEGGGMIVVHACERLEARIEGDGGLRYLGTPVVDAAPPEAVQPLSSVALPASPC